VVDVGAGAGFEAFVAPRQAGSSGRVIGVDMMEAMLAKLLATAASLAVPHVEFREGLAEALPVDDSWADA
jgi:ubiquinone/menaquinone biosynthesis C-methylase UbiE